MPILNDIWNAPFLVPETVLTAYPVNALIFFPLTLKASWISTVTSNCLISDRSGI